MVRKQTRRKSGGGWQIGPALTNQAYYLPEYKYYSNCDVTPRPGLLTPNPNPELAQTRMAGGRRSNCAANKPIGSIQSNPQPSLAQTPMAGGVSRRRRRGGGCGCGMKRRNGGSKQRKHRSRRSMKGGRYTMDITQSIGGDGPNVSPIYSNYPCEAHKPMPLNPTMSNLLGNGAVPDMNVSGLRPAFIMNGGQHPLAYNAPRAGFTFIPNISQGQKLEPGQIPYQEVVQQTNSCGSATCGQAIGAINK
jgi:hypothetical protein